MERFFSFFNGMVAGMSQVFVMQPFQIIKVRLQTQPENAKIYSGISDCFIQIVTKQGPLALFKGSLTPLMGVGLMGSMRFGFFQNFKKNLSQYKQCSVLDLQILDKSLCAFGAGFFNSFLLCIVEHTRIRIQIQKNSSQKKYTGSLNAAIQIFKNYGLKGLHRGQSASTIRQSTGLMFYFSTIEKLTDLLSPPGITSKKDLPLYVPILAGGIGGTTYWMFNYPVDYVKTLMQSDNLDNYKYKGIIDCFKKQYQKGGIRIFFKGYLICMMRSLPVNAAMMFTYRLMQRISQVTSH